MNDGFLLVDKPAGWTSHDVVAKSRRLCGTRRVGHAGTLDPMATGLLVLGVGQATKLLTFVVGVDKTYTGTMRLGESTLTDDADAEVLQRADASDVSDQDLAVAVSALTGPLQQVPSAVSAIKINGKRSYARVRAGEEVELARRSVTVHRFDIRRRTDGRGASSTPTTTVDLDFTVEVTSGTYVRALARDLGVMLGVGGHLTALRRVHVGPFRVQDARTLPELEALDTVQVLPLSKAAAAVLPVRGLDPGHEQTLRHGGRLPAVSGPDARLVAAMAPDGTLVAVLEETVQHTRSRVVFPAS